MKGLIEQLTAFVYILFPYYGTRYRCSVGKSCCCCRCCCCCCFLELRRIKLNTWVEAHVVTFQYSVQILLHCSTTLQLHFIYTSTTLQGASWCDTTYWYGIHPLIIRPCLLVTLNITLMLVVWVFYNITLYIVIISNITYNIIHCYHLCDCENMGCFP